MTSRSDVSSKPWHSGYVFNRELSAGRFRVVASMRSAQSFTGRFGGGWNWKLGVQAGGQTVIISLLVFTVRFEITRKR